MHLVFSLKVNCKVFNFMTKVTHFFVWKFLGLGGVRIQFIHIIEPDPNYFNSDPHHCFVE